MTCCIEGCNREAKHEATYGRICDRHRRQDQVRDCERNQQVQWVDVYPGTRIPDHMRSKGLQEEAERERHAEEGINE